MKYPDRKTAEEMLLSAAESNPGPWQQHSETAARAAEAIAAHCRLDTDRAYVLGLLHDIGRYEGVFGLHHAIAGYNLMMEKGYDGVARICLNHSFPIADSTCYNGARDCSPDELEFLDRALADMVYDDYDRLIQLCDALSTAGGVTPVEPRLLDVAIRHGVGNRYQEKWRAFIELKKYFDVKCGCNIYLLFRDDIERAIFR